MSGKTGKQTTGDNQPKASIVLLLPRPFVIGETILRAALSKAWGTDFSTNTGFELVLPMMEGHLYTVLNRGAVFNYHNIPSAYFPDSDAVARYIRGDDDLANNVRYHEAWLSFDVVTSTRPLCEQYDLIGSVLAELAPEQTVALYVVEREVLIRFDTERREQLKGPNTFHKLGFE
ncbi:MAG: hypothetical protein WCI73_01070 [Phycisphaerae bacterium]